MFYSAISNPMTLAIGGHILGGGIALNGVAREGRLQTTQIVAGTALMAASLLALLPKSQASSLWQIAYPIVTFSLGSAVCKDLSLKEAMHDD